jgi:hypothetical protein
MGYELRQRQGTALMQRQHRAELARGALPARSAVQKGARFEQARKESQPVVEFQAARDFRRGLAFVDCKGLGWFGSTGHRKGSGD